MWVTPLLLFFGTCRSVQDSDQFTLESDISSTEWIMWKKQKTNTEDAVWTQPCWISTVLLALHMYYLQQTSTTKQDKHMKKNWSVSRLVCIYTYIYLFSVCTWTVPPLWLLEDVIRVLCVMGTSCHEAWLWLPSSTPLPLQSCWQTSGEIVLASS